MISAKQYEIVKVRGLFGKTTYTFKDKETGKRCKARFKEVKIYDQENGGHVYCAKDEKGWAFFNPETGEICSDHFDDIRRTTINNKYMVTMRGFESPCRFYDALSDKLHPESWKVTKSNYFVMIDPKTKSELSDRFLDVVPLTKDLYCVRLKDGFWTFYNPITNTLFEERFNGIGTFFRPGTDVNEVGNDKEWFKKYTRVISTHDNKFHIFNTTTHEFLHFPFKNFISASGIVSNLNGKLYAAYAVLQLDDDKCVFYDFIDGYKSKVMDLETAQKLHETIQDINDDPEKFKELPTEFFRDKELIKIILNQISAGIKIDCDNDPSDELVNHAADMKEMIDKKIEQEKANIKAEDEYIAKEKAEKKTKKDSISKIIENISSLGD